MILRLQVSSESGRPRDPVLFRDSGGTIGRSEQCTCTLPDKFVSSFHARIHYRDGVFLIEDTSQNGIFINSAANRLERGQTYPLASGDLILIDPYEIRVTIDDPSRAASPLPEPGDPFGEEPVDPLVLLGGGGSRKRRPASRAEDLPIPSPVHVQYRPPDPIIPEPVEPVSSGGLIPKNWDDTGFGEKPEPTPPPEPPVRPVRPAKTAEPAPMRAPQPGGRQQDTSASGELSEVLRGAGLPPDLVTPQLAEDFGRIIRIIVSGVMEVLRSRQQIKDEFRMHQTKIQSTGNNPLKFSANLEDALNRLLVQRNAAYLEPVAAFEDAFEDVLHHQMAMLAGMRVAFDAMLKAFDPEVLQAEFDKHGKGSIISGPAKLRYWDQYKAKFGDMVADEDRFQNLFGEEFADAYDEQLERLKAGHRSGPPSEPNRSGRSRR